MGQYDIISLLKETGEKLSNREIQERLNTYNLSYLTCKLHKRGILDREIRYKTKEELEGRFRNKNNFRGNHTYYAYFIRDGVTKEEIAGYKPSIITEEPRA